MPLLEMPTSDRERSDTDGQSGRLKEATIETVVPHSGFYGLSRWDPSAKWTAKEERCVVRKTDLRLLGFFCVLYVGIQMEKTHLQNAITDSFLDENGLTTNDYNLALGLSRGAVFVSEMLTQYLVVKFGYRRVFPLLLALRSIFCGCQAFVQPGRRSMWLVFRFLIGFFEGGWYPGMIHFMNQFYTSRELTSRLAILGAMFEFANIAGNGLAAGVLQMRGLLAHPGWYWLFIIQGSLTTLLALICFCYLPTSPTRTKSLLCRQGWFTEREETIMTMRIIRDSPVKAQAASAFSMSWTDVKAACKDKSLWILYLSVMMYYLCALPPRQYLGITLTTAGFSITAANLLMMPSNALSMFTGIFWTFSSTKIWNEWGLHSAIGQAVNIPFLIALACFSSSTSKWVKWAVNTLLCGCPTTQSIAIGWLVTASYSTRKTAVALVIFTQLGLVGSSVAGFIYTEADKPLYRTANLCLIGISASMGVLFLIQRQICKHINKKRKAVWQKMDPQARLAYRKETEKEELHGNGRIDFQYPT